MKKIYCRLYTESEQTISEILYIDDKPKYKDKGEDALIISKLEELAVRYSYIYGENIVKATVGINNSYNIRSTPNGTVEITKEN